MDSFHFHFDHDSTLTNDTSSNSSDLDWTAFQSAPPPMNNHNPFSPTWLAQQDDAVAPDNRTNFLATPHDDGIYFEIEHFINGLNQQQQQQQQQQHSQPQSNQPPLVLPASSPEQEQGIVEPIHVNIHLSDPCARPGLNPYETPHRVHSPPIIHERPSTCLPAPLVPRLSSSRSQCYHKLPDHAVKLMQEWYNAHLDDPYPRSPDKKRFITEGNITAQQCRSWFANRRQRLKHVKRNHPRASSSASLSRSSQPVQVLTPIEEPTKAPDSCCYCQQGQPIPSSPLPLTLTSTPTSSTTATTLNVVINQQTVEQLIHNSLRKLLYPTVM